MAKRVLVALDAYAREHPNQQICSGEIPQIQAKPSEGEPVEPSDRDLLRARCYHACSEASCLQAQDLVTKGLLAKGSGFGEVKTLLLTLKGRELICAALNREDR